MTNWKCASCKLVIRVTSNFGSAEAPRCGICGNPMTELPTVGQDEVRADLTILTAETLQRHLRKAVPVAQGFVGQLNTTGVKPYENALALALALMQVCKQFGWRPHEVLTTIESLTP